LRCHLLVDQSRSMSYGSLTYSKADYARTFAATLAWFLHQQGDAVGLFSFDERVRDYLPARHRHGQLRQLMLGLEREPAGRATNLTEPLRRVAELARKRGLIVLISDLLAPVGELEKHLARLTAAGHELVVFQVLDPNELAFNFQDATLFQDVESEKDIYIDPAAVREIYQRRLREHGEGVEAICRKLGFAFHRVLTDRPLDLALLDFLRSRVRRGRLVRRRQQRTSK
ncbi:MAG TPA: VWA domain-containing protein, partial [Candidatus Cybelea sp.]|nr:VWA domain-containing protein [Candidatus Cybelea sp.]